MSDYENDNSENEENEEIEDLNDDDHGPIDEYAAQNEDLKAFETEEANDKFMDDDDDEDPLNDMSVDKESDNIADIYKNTKRKKKSGIIKMSKYEYAKLYGSLAYNLINSVIELPPEMEKEDIVETGDCFSISRFWIANRHKYPIPLSILRNLYLKTNEVVDPAKLLIDDDLSFKDDNDDTERFNYNFRDKPYETCY